MLVFSTTYEIDQKYGTEYHKNFVEYLKYVQENDIVVDGAMTDPKGDRGLAPSAQRDADLFLRISRKKGRRYRSKRSKMSPDRFHKLS